jgi:CheY-like chemotaxis protein
MKILIVEDDEGTAAVLNQALTAQHYVVEMATDGQLGWDLLEVFKYDLILLDVTLSKLDGITLCQRLREKGDLTPILLLMAQDGSTKKVTGLDAGADDYIVKPYEMALNSSGIRDTARVLKISPSTVIEALKKASDLNAVNAARLCEFEPSQIIVNLCQWENVEAEVDEMCDAITSPLGEFCRG